MSKPTTKEQAIQVLQILTAEHGDQSYFVNAEVVYDAGSHGVDIHVDADKWRARERKESVPLQINRVPVCVVLQG